ncbi:MAG: hypothetical protein A2X46_04275 [Lentisphaerae bacterium GWF2_57_35]|nr:MAG: hypothetical protein A2X46_04275 [Lentisphaerae bacterium GWF2_57_35]
MKRKEFIRQLLRCVDARDAGTFLAFLSNDVTFRFGNSEAVRGKAEVHTVVDLFFQSIRSLRHDILEQWEQGDASICHGLVTYTRVDSSTLTVPFANIFNFKDELISEYYIFADVSELHKAPQLAHPTK